MSGKVNPEGMKWPSDKGRYDREYLRIFGKVCSNCKGHKGPWPDGMVCPYCDGNGYVERKK